MRMASVGLPSCLRFSVKRPICATAASVTLNSPSCSRRATGAAASIPTCSIVSALKLRALLLLVVRDRRLDRVLRQHRAMDLDRWQVELLGDLRVLELGRLVDRHALDPLG